MPSGESSTMQLELGTIYVPGEGDEKRPLTVLSSDESHVHGELIWTISGRRVPDMGFWGPDDVCLGEWWDGFSDAVHELARGTKYRLDSYEQGSSAFVFERSGPSVLLSIIASAARGPPEDWQGVAFGWEDFVREVRRFKEELRSLITTKGPATLPAEWQERLSKQ